MNPIMILWLFVCFGKAAKSPSLSETILALPEVVLAVVGLVFHLFIIGYTVHLIANMSVPKRAS
ncbi:Protein jagunal 1 [Gossypium australe]|uniref:Protein jagunal 1 n=1 Tax=Gossypium australe TaxID=47621 RepID=A0A5B6VDG5_9ROSI|nr:Protein jagunal 1 [Gossypium australe]